MRRVVSAALVAVLAGVLWCGVASADVPDLASSFAMRTFGRLPVEAPAYSVSSQTALRGVAFRMRSPLTLPPLRRTPPSFAPALAYDEIADLGDTLTSMARFVPTAVAPAHRAAPARFRLTGTSIVVPAYAQFGVPATLDDVAPAFSSSLRDAKLENSGPMQVGAFAVSGGSDRFTVAAMAAHDDRMHATTAVAVGAPGRKVAIDVGSDYERLNTLAVPVIPTFAYRPGGSLAPSFGDVPGYDSARLAGTFNDVTTVGVNAGLAVPIAHNMTLGMQYGTQRYTGMVGSSDFTPNLDTSKYSYVGNVTFALPRSSSSIVVSARQYRFQDNLNVNNTLYQTRADVNFTVKF